MTHRRPLASIIVPVRDLLRYTRLCLESVRAHTPEPCEVLVVDNASGPAVREYLRALSRSWPALRVLRSRANLPFAQAVNRGIRESSAPYLVWLNNDAVVGPEWLSRLIACVERVPSAAAAGPCTNDKGCANCLGRLHRPKPALMPLLSQAWALRSDGLFREAPLLSAFCVLLKRAAVERAGLLDERFLWGNEDDDYCYRLRLAGYKLLLALDVLVCHYGSRSLRRHPPAIRRARARANRDLLLRKWLDDARRIQADVRKFNRKP